NGTEKTLALDRINPDSLQPRTALKEALVRKYAAEMKKGVQFDPIVVFHDSESGTYWLSDGFHRVEASKRVGRTEIRAQVRAGTRQEALRHAVGVDAKHGRQLTSADKRRAIMLLLEFPEFQSWFNPKIAE